MRITDYRNRFAVTASLVTLATALMTATPTLAAPRAVLGELFSMDN